MGPRHGGGSGRVVPEDGFEVAGDLLGSPLRGGNVSRDLAQSTLDRLRRRLGEERGRLLEVIQEIEEEREEVRLTETSSERSPDPNTAEGGSLAFELEKELSVARNAEDLLSKVDEAMMRMDEGTYGNCIECGKPIPVARLDALPYATLCVECASAR
jgi:RNA polymerase-binding protein DksA